MMTESLAEGRPGGSEEGLLVLRPSAVGLARHPRAREHILHLRRPQAVGAGE